MGNSFAQGLAKAADKLGLQIDLPAEKEAWETDPEMVPMMYRAQIQGRCSLQYAGRENRDLDDWRDQWVYPGKDGQARYQKSRPALGLEHGIYRVEVEFPDRVFSNCGQDSIARPTLGKDGIPFLPGSSVKGLFRRGCNAAQAKQYCGDASNPDRLTPGSLRFHGAYPIGNWADRIVDLVHPQQERQLGTEKERPASAFALISFYQPRFVFEFSSANSAIDWQEVERILLQALQLGAGGKTSSGYGLGGNFPGMPPIKPAAPISVLLQGQGVSSVLRDGVTPEFRPNLFKAGLRGHLKRLLGGVCNRDDLINPLIEDWFGQTDRPARLRLLWQERQPIAFQDVGLEQRNPTYRAAGFLYLDLGQRQLSKAGDRGPSTTNPQTEHQSEIEFLRQVLCFAYVMGGFGKSWRRVWHGDFYPEYHQKKFAIGCHWQSDDFDQVRSPEQLQQFLARLHQTCCDRLGISKAQAANWREAWHPTRVAVLSRVGSDSAAIRLFHAENFKTTPAIGGRKPKDERPTSVSSVWHRMLPIENGQFLEIVTLFHGDRCPWIREQENQLQPFIQQLKNQGFSLTWGSLPAPQKPKRIIGKK